MEHRKPACTRETPPAFFAVASRFVLARSVTTRSLAKALQGWIDERAVCDSARHVYVLEVNRASRTIPYVSKATGVRGEGALDDGRRNCAT